MERRLAQLTATALDAELERSRLQRDLRWLNARIASAIVIAPERQPADRVAFGACVDVVDDESGERRRYRIVGEDEAAPEHGDVSWRSPLARALDGARVGDQVTWPRPAGPVDLEIRAIRYEDG